MNLEYSVLRRLCFNIETHNYCAICKNIPNLLKPKPVTTFYGYLSLRKNSDAGFPLPELGKRNLPWPLLAVYLLPVIDRDNSGSRTNLALDPLEIAREQNGLLKKRLSP
jgi:hypothetical protein